MPVPRQAKGHEFASHEENFLPGWQPATGGQTMPVLAILA